MATAQPCPHSTDRKNDRRSIKMNVIGMCPEVVVYARNRFARGPEQPRLCPLLYPNDQIVFDSDLFLNGRFVQPVRVHLWQAPSCSMSKNYIVALQMNVNSSEKKIRPAALPGGFHHHPSPHRSAGQGAYGPRNWCSWSTTWSIHSLYRRGVLEGRLNTVVSFSTRCRSRPASFRSTRGT